MPAGFFAIHRTWPVVCEMGLNAAVAYLVLARGTGAGNRTSAWSVHAIEKHTGLSRRKAEDALGALQATSLIRVTRGSTGPLYDLVRASEVPGTSAFRRPLDKVEEAVVARVRRGDPVRSQDRGRAQAAAQKGWLIDLGNWHYECAKHGAEKIWLPNTIVTGARTETPPLELIRRGQDVMPPPRGPLLRPEPPRRGRHPPQRRVPNL